MANNFNINLSTSANITGANNDLKKLQQQIKSNPISIPINVNTAKASLDAKTQIKTMATELQKTLASQNIKVDMKTSSALVRQQFKEMEASAKNYGQVLKQQQALSSSAFNLSTGKVTLDNRITTYLQNNSKLTSELRAKLVGLQAEIKNADKTKLDQLNKSFRSVSAEASALGKTGDTVLSKLTKNLKQFLSFLSSGTIIMTFIRQIKEAATFAIDMDTALTNINYTMDVTDSQLKKIGNSSIQMAKDLNTSAKNVLQAVTLYANANETADSILNKARPAIMLSNVTGMSGTESAKTLQSVMNQFDMSQDDLMGISDTLQGVSQNLAYDFAAGIQEISSGIQESGSVAKDAGLSLGEYSSMIGLILEQTGQTFAHMYRKCA